MLKRFYIIWILLIIPVLGQEMQLKKILVEYFKYQDSNLTVKADKTLDGEYPLYFADNPKPAYLYFNLPANNNDKLQPVFDKIMEALRFKDEDTFNKLYQQIKQDYPNSPFLITLQARQEKRNYNYEKAIKLFKQAIKENPMDDFACINLAGVYRNMDDNKNAVRYTILAIATNPLYKNFMENYKYLFDKADLKLEGRWFKPAWKKTGPESYEVSNMDWEYFVKALASFGKLKAAELKRISGIENPILAKYVLSFRILFHYEMLNQTHNKLIKRIRKIDEDGYLEPFILSEILPYFPEEWQGVPSDKLDQVIEYYNKYYVK